MNQSSTIPIHIISGFLGAGKTTLINHMLRAKPEENTVLLENEFGEAGIDHQLIQTPRNEIFQINSGCICCQNSNALMDTLQRILTGLTIPDRLIIECTGIALPENIIALFYSDPYLQNHYHIANVVTVIDAAQFEDQIQLYPEPVHQLAYADIVLINKVDLVRKEYLQELRTIIHTVQTDAVIVEADWENLSLETIFQPTIQSFENNLLNTAAREKPNKNTSVSHFKYKSYTFSFNQPFDILTLRHLLSVWLLIQKMRFIRIKGIISIPDESNKVIIQSAGNQTSFKTIPSTAPVDDYKSTLVIIGLQLDQAVIEKQLKQCLLASPSTPLVTENYFEVTRS